MVQAVLPSLNLKNRLALVTGSSRALGWAMAHRLASAGARVVLHGRDRDALHARAHDLAARGPSAADTIAFDVSDGPASANAMHDVAARYGPLGILVNNAGLIVRRPVLETSDAEWELHDRVAGLTPAGCWERREELQGAAVFLASDAASYVTGQILMVGGGLTAAL